ncbi:MAG: nicotinate-nicotinamide nucleotide adenylyltransferase, partial [Actinobacteria bacterium]|nr:nicotinate-nicotinamide nucleotide adenylyltransferase [Actinomycetota bacterium]NIU20816.1 nicotinate-nicotinamide nucleotide adenylyltransferase [Actinomycetota bacterium]NIV57324.1 adenylyltransferase/cytidyltransferase family protein [Actinomycetota bacterium]NIX52122.1 adenylyltransferase/cytidyltransferase family protein [Actinomycetota bacterium]
MTELLALFGGTFDPVHYGHLRPLEELRQALGLRRIRLVPSAVPPHRESPGASPSERLHMLRLACEEYPAFEVDPRELRRRGPSYTVDTLTELSREHPRRCP